PIRTRCFGSLDNLIPIRCEHGPIILKDRHAIAFSQLNHLDCQTLIWPLAFRRKNDCTFDKAAPVPYVSLQYMATSILDRELKKGSAELLILPLGEDRPRHGYDIGQRIELRPRGTLRFNVASLYPLLYRLEKRGWIRGRWVEKAGQRRRRY